MVADAAAAAAQAEHVRGVVPESLLSKQPPDRPVLLVKNLEPGGIFCHNKQFSLKKRIRCDIFFLWLENGPVKGGNGHGGNIVQTRPQ